MPCRTLPTLGVIYGEPRSWCSRMLEPWSTRGRRLLGESAQAEAHEGHLSHRLSDGVAARGPSHGASRAHQNCLLSEASTMCQLLLEMFSW